MATETEATFVRRYDRDNSRTAGLLGCERIEVRATRRVVLLWPEDLIEPEPPWVTALRERIRADRDAKGERTP